jgi:hypothetical protein
MSRSCAVCRSPTSVREAVDAMLASDKWKSPNRISRAFPRLSRPQIRHHRDECLRKSPRWVRRLRTDPDAVEDLREALRGAETTEENIEQIVTALQRAAQGPEVREAS